VAHSYNPSYTGGRDQEDCSLKPVQAQSQQDPISTNKKLGIKINKKHVPVIPGVRGINMRIEVQAGPSKTQTPIPKITKAKRTGGCGSSGILPAQQAQSLELKPQYLPQKPKKHPSIKYLLTSSMYQAFKVKIQFFILWCKHIIGHRVRTKWKS
jgi:hypothetical protein